MRRAAILGASPYLHDYYRFDASSLLRATGGNTGNLAFLYAVSEHLGPSVPFVSIETPINEIRHIADVLILPLANQLGRHTNLIHLAEKLEALALPVVGVGLGAQLKSMDENIELQPGTKRWLETMARLSPSDQPNIGVRGEFTKCQMGRYGVEHAAAVIGCPSNFINSRDDIASQLALGFSKRPRRIAVTAGIPYIPALATTEQNLAALVSETDGAYIVQHDLEMVQLARREFDRMQPTLLETCRQYICPHLDTAAFLAWCERHARVFGDVQAWMDYLRRFDFVIGTRLHGAMLALQAGVPAACIAHDSRTLELCETMGMPARSFAEIGTLTQDNLTQVFKFDEMSFRETRRRLLQAYVRIYDSAEVMITEALAQLLQK